MAFLIIFAVIAYSILVYNKVLHIGGYLVVLMPICLATVIVCAITSYNHIGGEVWEKVEVTPLKDYTVCFSVTNDVKIRQVHFSVTNDGCNYSFRDSVYGSVKVVNGITTPQLVAYNRKPIMNRVYYWFGMGFLTDEYFGNERLEHASEIEVPADKLKEFL